MLAKTEKNIQKYIKNGFEFNDCNNACTILNIVIEEKEKRKELFAKIKEIPVDEDKKERVSFIDENGKIKMVIIASFDYVNAIMELIKDVIA